MVVDESSGSGQATKAAAGMLGVHTENHIPGKYHEFCLRSRDLYEELSKELFDLTAIDIGLSPFGMREVATDERHVDALKSKYAAFPHLDWMEGDQLRNEITCLSDQVLGALSMKRDGHVEPYKVCEAFKKAALCYGGSLVEYESVLGIEKVGDYFEIKLKHESIQVKRVVVASGAASGRWFTETGLTNPMVPTKGECFAIKPRKAFFKEALFFNNFYIVPKPDGRYIIGATSSPFNVSTDTTAGGISSLMNLAFHVVPDFKQASLENYWSGVRPGSADGVPIIGEHPDYSGLYFATGHYRNGILLAPSTGQMIKDLMTGQQVDKSIKDMLSPKRFEPKGGAIYEYSS